MLFLIPLLVIASVVAFAVLIGGADESRSCDLHPLLLRS